MVVVQRAFAIRKYNRDFFRRTSFFAEKILHSKYWHCQVEIWIGFSHVGISLPLCAVEPHITSRFNWVMWYNIVNQQYYCALNWLVRQTLHLPLSGGAFYVSGDCYVKYTFKSGAEQAAPSMGYNINTEWKKDKTHNSVIAIVFHLTVVLKNGTEPAQTP